MVYSIGYICWLRDYKDIIYKSNDYVIMIVHKSLWLYIIHNELETLAKFGKGKKRLIKETPK